MRFFARAALVLASVLLVLIAIVVVRAERLADSEPSVSPASAVTFDDAAAAERLAGAIRIPTVSFTDSAPRGPELLALHAYIARSFPRVTATLSRELVDDYSLLYRWPGSDSALRPVVLMGHLDVVPVEPGSESRWRHPAFAGAIGEGFIWGRGATDDKVGALEALEGVEYLLTQGFQPRRTIYLAFGHDEEVRGEGATAIAKLLHSRGVVPELVLDEGGAVTTGLVPGVHRPVALIGIAEKGYVSVQLDARDAGGHSSSPPRETTVGILGMAIARLEREPFPARLAPPTRSFLDHIAPAMAFRERLAMANLWLFEPVVLRMFALSPASDALIRTTTAPTMFEGSVKDNVLPSHARAVVNFRILPGDSVAGVLAHVQHAVRDDRVKIGVYGDMQSEASLVSSIDSPAYATVEKTIREVFPDVVVAPDLLTGASDARNYHAFSSNVYGFNPLVLSAETLEGFHGTNERVSVDAYGRAIRWVIRLLQNETS